MSGECKTKMASWEAVIDELYHLYMTSWETTINDLYLLYNACKKGKSQEVSEIVQRLRNIKFKVIVGIGTTTLHLMCLHGNLRMVKLLVEMYGNETAKLKDENQQTPLHLACLQDHLDIIHYLTYNKERSALQCEDKYGWTPSCLIQDKVFRTWYLTIKQLHQLYEAYKRGSRPTLVQYFLKAKFVLKNTNCTTTLHFMCRFGYLDMIMSLIEMYGNVEARDENGHTPLHIACLCGQIDVVKYLINRCGCNIEARDKKGYTPLFVACLTGQTDTVHHLVTNFRCKFDVRDHEGRTPLHAASERGHYKVVRYLISHCGCSPEVRDDEMEHTPLHLACSISHLEIVKYLTSECRCNLEARDKYNRTPLFLAYASYKKQLQPVSHSSQESGYNARANGECIIKAEVVSYLILEQGCNPDAKTVFGESPILQFYLDGELTIIKHCIKLKKHNPKTWKHCISSSQALALQRRNITIAEELDSSHQAQSRTYMALSPLHIACFGRSMDVIKFLVEECGLDPLEKAELIGSDKGVFNLITMEHSFASTDDAESTFNQNTPLSLVCFSGRLDMLQYLISKSGSAVSHYYHVLMRSACSSGQSDIMKFLLKYSTPTEDKNGNTMLHYATTGRDLKGAYEILKILIPSMTNLDQRNFLGETALHTACKTNPCRTSIIELLLSSGCNSQISNFAGKTPLWLTQSSKIFKVFMRYSPTDVCERILSDDINEEQSLKLFQCLIKQHNWNPNEKTKDGDTALHLACKADRLTIIKYLFSVETFKYDPYSKNKSNQTPIELTSSKEIINELIKHGSNPVDLVANLIMDEEQVLQLVREINEDKLNGITINDNNALHLACLTDRVTIVKYLLRNSKIDVNTKNESDISPIQLTRNAEIIKELIRYGANPTDLYNYCRKVLRESKPLQTTVKVFVLGDSNAGKSTLISSLRKEGWFNFFTSRSSTTLAVTDDNMGSGHGIITHDFNSKHCGQVTLYDFVGKRLYHESQSDLLCKTSCSPRVFLVVTNLSGSDEEIISSLQFWLSFLEEMAASDLEFKNHTIVVGSNIDKCRKDEKRMVNMVKCFLQDRVNNLTNVDYHDFVALDCRNHNSSDITRLRRCLAKLCVIARNPKSLVFNAHCFQVYIVDRFKERVAVSINEILNKIRVEEKDVDENDPLNFLPQSEFQLQNLCVELHNKSHILYLRDSAVGEMGFETSWFIIDKAALISQLFEAFESKIFKRLPSNCGILSFSTISELGPFKIYNFDMFVRFLCHLEYCKEISDQETLQAITNSASVRLTSERCFFFPALIENSAPEGIWDGHSGSFSYHCGWILQCTKPEQFFASKFLQTLILRVMFCNTYLGPSGTGIPALLKCSLWKGGIFWGNIFGAESLVEVLPDNKAVVFLMRCRDANLAKCMQHRSTIIHQIRKCAKEFCGNLKTSESLIFPSLITKYPVHTTPSDLFDIKTLAFAVANVTSIEQPYATSLTGTNMIPIHELLKFEPYVELTTLIIQELCNINNPRYISCLTNDFLIHFIQQIRKNTLFIEIITQILNDHGILDSNVDNLLIKLVEWRDTCHITYQQLHGCIDQFSIFAGLNFMVCLLPYGLICV